MLRKLKGARYLWIVLHAAGLAIFAAVSMCGATSDGKSYVPDSTVLAMGAMGVIVLVTLLLILCMSGRRARAHLQERLATKTKQAEDALRQADHRTSILLENISDAFFSLDPNMVLTAINTRAARALGCSEEVVMGRTLLHVFPQLRGTTIEKNLTQALNEKTPSQFEAHLVVPHEDWYDVHIYPHPEGISVFFQIITERKRAEEELRLLTETIRQVSEAVVITKPDGSIEYVNPAFERITGFTGVEVLGQTPRILKSGKHESEFYKGLWSTILAGEQWSGRIINRRKDGTLYTDECTISPVKNDRGEIERFVALKRNITRELELEERFRQSERLESVGRMAAGVAHDFGNLLSPVLGYAEMLLNRTDVSDPSHRMAQAIQQSAEHARDLVHELLAFGRKQVLETKTQDLRLIVNDMEQLIRRTLRENISVDVSLSPEPTLISADASQIGQVLVNLAVNAQDAMPEGGSLTIEVLPVTLDDAFCKNYTGLEPGSYVMLGVVDSGCGMDTDTLSHIFEPFFTTKQDVGTGLGLATVYGIVKQHGGSVMVYSEPGKGTAFKVYLPAVQEETVTSETPPLSPSKASLHGSETVLVVEDNEVVQLLASHALTQHNYTTLLASSGPEALQILEAHKGKVHLLLTDVVMPEMDGGTLADEASAKYPELKVLFMSGYSRDDLLKHYTLREAFEFIQKPFSVMDLAKKVRRVLDAPLGNK